MGRRPARTGPPAPRAGSASRELTAWASTGPSSLPGGPGAQQPHLCEVPGASRWGHRMELTPRLSGLSPGCWASNCAPPPIGPRGAGWCFEKPCTVTPFPVLGPGGGAEPCEKPCRRQSARGGPRRRRCAAETWRALAGEAPGAEGLVSAGVSGLVWAVLPAPGQRPRRWPLKPGGTEPARPAHGEAAGAGGEAAVPGAAQRPLLCSPPPGTAGPDADPAPAATPATGRRVAVPQQRACV